MVEFGLKLEDNKVSEWAKFYIDYARLKKYLERAKKASEARDALKKRRPALAAEVIEAYRESREAHLPPPTASDVLRAGGASDAPSQREASSAPSLIKLPATDRGEGESEVAAAGRVPSPLSVNTADDRFGDASADEADADAPLGGGTKEEMTPLVANKSTETEGSGGRAQDQQQSYGSRMVRNLSTKSFTSMSAASTGVGSNADLTMARSESAASMYGMITGYFQGGRYAHKLIESLRIIDEQLERFDLCLREELGRVIKFHDEKLEEQQKRLEVLVESVGTKYDVVTSTRNRPDTFLKLKGAVHKSVTETIASIRTPEKGTILGSGGLASIFDDDESDDEALLQVSDADMQEIIRESGSIKRALTDQHRTSLLLNNYAVMNYTGFVKIIKKFGKIVPERKNVYKDFLKGTEGIEGVASERLAHRMEKIFADWFCDGDMREARAKMLPKRGDGLQMDWSQLRLGYRLGMCSILTLWVCWDCIWGLVSEGQSSIGGRTAFPVFRACGGLLLVHWFWGVSVYIWSRYRINYIFLFDFNPRIVDSPLSIFDDVVDESLVFLILMLLYYKSGAQEMPDMIPPGCYPLLLVLYTLKCLIFPLRTRGPLWSAIREVITAPLTSPNFFHTYVADVFTSMIKVFQDIAWAIVFIVSGDFWVSENQNYDMDPHHWQHKIWYKNILIPLVCLFPLWIRFNQCLRRYMDTKKRLPNLANALKYAMSQTVTLFGAFHPIYLLHEKKVRFHHHHGQNSFEYESTGFNLFQIFWVGLFIASSCYSFIWDVYMDWGLGRPSYGFLGPRLMFPNKFYYYGVMALDLVLRFLWVQSLIPPQSGASFEIPSYLTLITMALELFRRTLWGFFRLEHEHRHNTEGYRRVDFVPLHFATGHDRKYKKQQQRIGVNVLAEVFIISSFVIGISFLSIIAAQKATESSGGL